MRPEITNLEDALRIVGNVEGEYEIALNNSADKEYAYEIAFSTAILKSVGTNAETRKADAVLKCQKEFQEHLKAEARKTFMKSKMTDAQNAVSARQSILTNSTKTNFGQSGYGA